MQKVPSFHLPEGGESMSTRGAIAVREGRHSSFVAFYRHHDTYPTCLGVELLAILKEMAKEGDFSLRTFKERLADINAKEQMGIFSSPEQVFRVQGDLEWIYTVELVDADHTCLSIYRTSNPWMEKSMVWRVWGSFLRYAPADAEGEMRMIDGMAECILMALREFEKRILEESQSTVT